MRMGKYKFVKPGINPPWELYDLETDIGETTNIAGQHPELISKLETILKSARTESEHWKTPWEKQ